MTTPSQQLSDELSSDEISLSDIWQALRARSRLILTSTLISAAVAGGIAFSMTPIYRSQVVSVIAESQEGGSGFGQLAGQFGGLASLAGVGLGGGGSGHSEVMGTLASRQLIESYIESHHLLPILFEKKWDQERGDWKRSLSKKPTLWDGTEFFIKQVRAIDENKKNGLITLTIEWKDAALAARWAADLVNLTNQQMRDRAIAKSEANLSYLNTQLEKSSVVELRQAIYRLIEAEVKNIMVAQGSDEYALKVIDPSVVAEKKIKPKRSLIVAVGAFLGLFLAALVALVQAPARLLQ